MDVYGALAQQAVQQIDRGSKIVIHGYLQQVRQGQLRGSSFKHGQHTVKALAAAQLQGTLAKQSAGRTHGFFCVSASSMHKRTRVHAPVP